jgi:hypothetical protein
VPTHYETLGVPPAASNEEIRRAYRNLAQRFHPDRHLQSAPSDAARASEKMREINQAWQVLSDAGARQHYDLELSLARIKAQRDARPPRPAAAAYRPPPRPRQPFDQDDADLVDVAPSYGVWTAIFRAAPWLLVIVVLGGIFVFTAFAASHNSAHSKDPVVRPTAQVGSCIRWLAGTELGIVDCNKANDGRLVEKVAVGQRCRVGTAPAYLPDEQVYGCIAP